MRVQHALGVLLAGLACQPAEAQPEVVEPTTVWRVADPEIPVGAFLASRSTFSRDGRLVAVVRQNLLVQLRSAADGQLLGELRANPANRDNASLWYDVAFSKTGNIALGGLRHVEIYDGSLKHLTANFPCGTCLVVEGLDFSPDGRLLAFQETRTFPERAQRVGSVHVIDTQSGVEVAQLSASAGRTKVRFAADGRTLFAMVTDVFPDRRESLGFQSWRVSDWAALRKSTEEAWTFGTFAIGRVAGTDVAVHAHDGHLEMHDSNDGHTIWSVPLLSPLFVPRDLVVKNVDLVRIALAPNGQFLVDYERPITPHFYFQEAGALVVRRANNGEVAAVYDVHGVTDIDIAPDSRTFLFVTGTGTPQTVMVRVPPLE
jgi:hypothetical protein